MESFELNLGLEPNIVEVMRIYRLGIVNHVSYDIAGLDAGRPYRPHIHEKSDAILCILSGSGLIALGGKEHEYSPSSTFFVPRGTSHGFSPSADTLILSIQSPPIRNHATGTEDIHF